MIAKPLSLWASPTRPAILGLVLFFCAGFADGALIPFFPLWAQSAAGIPTGLIGLLFACYAGGELIATPVIGGIADRVGRKPVLVLSALGVGSGFVALFFTHGVVAAALVLLLTGIAESVLHPTISTMIADVTPPEAHRRWFSRVRVSASAGAVLGPAVGALLALLSLRSVFLAAGGILLLGAVAMLCFGRETIGLNHTDALKNDGDDDEEEESLSALRPALRDRRLAALLLWFLLFEVAGNWVDSVLPLFAKHDGLLSASGIGLLFAYAAGLTVCLQMLVHRFGEARSALWLTLVAGGASVLAFACLILSPSVPALIGAVSLCAFAQMLTGPLVPTTVNALAPPARRAAYMAASSVAVDLKDSLGPATGTALFALAPRLPWLVGIPLVALASLGLGAALSRAPEAAAMPGRTAPYTET